MASSYKTSMISIIMGIYNCAKTLPEAVNSILSQTYDNWELIMCDDGSSDGTYKVALEYKEKYPDKIVLLKNEKNMGLNYTLNRCLESVRGEYIARMDGDDLSLPMRFEQEVNFLDKNPDYAIVSTPMIYFDEKGEFRWGEGKGEPDPKRLAYGTIFCHAHCMVRKEAYEAVGGYTVANNRLRVEDWDLWIRMYEKGYKGFILKEPLYKMRDDRNAYSRRKYRYRINEFLVGISAVKKLKLNPLYCLLSVRPLIVGLLPKKIYLWLHRA